MEEISSLLGSPFWCKPSDKCYEYMYEQVAKRQVLG